jgi:hypothetical protein
MDKISLNVPKPAMTMRLADRSLIKLHGMLPAVTLPTIVK